MATFLKKYKKQKKKKKLSTSTIERGFGHKNVILSLMELYCKGGLEPSFLPEFLSTNF